MPQMRYRQLGDSGLAVSVIGIGCNNFGGRIGPERVAGVVGAALDAGITLFDTSDTYGSPRGASEQLLGDALDGRRDQVVLATKFGNPMDGSNGPDWGRRGSRRYVRIAVEASLRRLGTDWIDLYQMHNPDPGTPIGETLSALDDLVHEGKIRYAGCSNFAAWQVADADWTARELGTVRFISAQNEYSLLQRDPERELLPVCNHFGLGVLPYFPLASGLLTGKYRRGAEPPPGTRLSGPSGLDDAPWERLEALEAFAADRGHSLLELAISALASRAPVASVIAGATSAEQVAANTAAGQCELSAAELTELDRLLDGAA